MKKGHMSAPSVTQKKPQISLKIRDKIPMEN
jgi:hypothetical protein